MSVKLGRKPAKNAPALRLASFLSTTPEHPLAVDYLNIGGWQVLGNDQYGDCVAVTWANYRRLMTRLAGAETYPNLNAVIEVYKTQNPGFPAQDDGMDIQTLLELLVHEDQVIAFAKVDHTNPDEVAAAIAIFGAVWVGVDVTAANMQQFDHGQPWDYVRSTDEGGHSIIVGGYDSDHRGGNERFITWGTETSFTDAFWSHQVAECWVVVWPENLGTLQFLDGIDTTKLAAAYLALTGRQLVLPPPTPTPAPAPQPTPTPTVDIADIAAAMNAWADGLHSLRTKAGKAAAAWRAYAAANGLDGE